MIKPVVRLLLIATFLAPLPTFAAADQPHIQFCWTIGKFDHTVYYAEVENREDRQSSFEALLEISGIDPATKFAVAPPKNPLLKTVAAGEPATPPPPVLRPGQNEFSEHCDIAGGFGGFGGFGRF